MLRYLGQLHFFITNESGQGQKQQQQKKKEYPKKARYSPPLQQTEAKGGQGRDHFFWPQIRVNTLFLFMTKESIQGQQKSV